MQVLSQDPPICTFLLSKSFSTHLNARLSPFQILLLTIAFPLVRVEITWILLLMPVTFCSVVGL